MKKTKLIRVSERTHKTLMNLGRKGESFDDIIKDLLLKSRLKKYDEFITNYFTTAANSEEYPDIGDIEADLQKKFRELFAEELK